MVVRPFDTLTALSKVEGQAHGSTELAEVHPEQSRGAAMATGPLALRALGILPVGGAVFRLPSSPGKRKEEDSSVTSVPQW